MRRATGCAGTVGVLSMLLPAINVTLPPAAVEMPPRTAIGTGTRSGEIVITGLVLPSLVPPLEVPALMLPANASAKMLPPPVVKTEPEPTRMLLPAIKLIEPGAG